MSLVVEISPAAANTSRAAAPRRLSVVVHRGGARVVAGDYDDSRRWVSHTLQTTGRSAVTMPQFEGTDTEYRQILSCVRSEYRGLPVDFVEKPPASGDYLLVVLGGSARELGISRVWGYSSEGEKAVVPKGVGFVFSADIYDDDRPAAVCQTLTHEVGHMIGLDHSTDCNDVMSTTLECRHWAPSKGGIHGFQQANWSILTRSLAAWAKTPDTRIADAPRDKTQKTRALVSPPKH